VTDTDATVEALVPSTTVAALMDRETTVPLARATVLPTGFDPLDDVVGGGFRAHDLVLVGGRPGIGKTVASLQWARTMAMGGHTALYVSYEHTPAALFARLLALELASLARADERSALPSLRRTAEEVALGAVPAKTLTDHPLGEEAYHRLRQYGPRLRLVQGSALRTGVVELARVVSRHRGDSTALFVDYLQKVPVADELRGDDDRTRHLAERLKELAMIAEVPVIALAAADHEGLTARRMRLSHLRGSTALAHECDIAILMNEKATAVSKAHLAYDPVRAESFRRWTVFSVEKNREGAPDLNLEFFKDLANYRFEPQGGFVGETLIDSLLVEE
jgi:replicative DNA helicase